MVAPRRKPTSVRPPSSASEAASEEGADTAASTGTPIMIAFCASSNEARPLTSSTWPDSGSRPERSAQPATLSTALCRPTSSRSASSVPSGVNRPAACRPPVRLNTRCASLSRSGSPASTAGETRTGSAATSKVDRVRIASMLSLPHTPHALVVRKFRPAPGPVASVRPGLRVTAATFSSHMRISSTSASRESRPSVNKNPAARSMSSPGVRIVTVSGSPSTRISSGSSAARRSARCSAAPDTVTRSTRRLAVVPLILRGYKNVPDPAGGRVRHIDREASKEQLDGEVEQRLRAARVTQLRQRLLLELPDPLAGQTQRPADLVERVRVAVIQPEPHRHDRRLARRQRVERRTQLLSHQLTVNELRRLGRVDVLDQVADAGLAVLADGRIQADRLAAGAQQFLDLVRSPVKLDSQLLGRRLAAQALVHVALNPAQLAEHLEHVHRQPNSPGRVGEATLDGLPDPPHGVGGELVALGVVELLDRPDQAQVSFLHHVKQGQAPVAVLLGYRNDQAQVRLEHVRLGAPPVLGDHLKVTPEVLVKPDSAL